MDVIDWHGAWKKKRGDGGGSSPLEDLTDDELTGLVVYGLAAETDAIDPGELPPPEPEMLVEWVNRRVVAAFPSSTPKKEARDANSAGTWKFYGGEGLPVAEAQWVELDDPDWEGTDNEHLATFLPPAEAGPLGDALSLFLVPESHVDHVPAGNFCDFETEG